MQFSEFKTEVFRRLDENAVAPVYWSEADIELSLNEGMEELADATEYYETSQSLALAANTTYCDILTFTREPLRVTSIYNPVTNRWLIPSSVKDLDFLNTRWETVPGEPERFFLRGLWKLGVYPKPTVIRNVDVYHSAVPPRMTAPTDTPGFPIDFDPALIEYALFDLFAQDGEVKEALAHWDKYLVYEAALLTWVKGRMKDRIGTLHE